MFYDLAMDELDHPVWDGDNHYYEAVDAFTRHLDPKDGPRCVQWATIKGRPIPRARRQGQPCRGQRDVQPGLQAGLPERVLPRQPGQGQPAGRCIRDSEPIRPAYRDPGGRGETLDQQGLEGCFLFPTLGMIYEEPLKDDPVAVCKTFRAFNRWLAEDWTFDYQGRVIYAAPYLALADRDWAVEELEWAIDQRAPDDRHADRLRPPLRPGG